ncbi:MAG: NAD kinase [Alphaproteobacteria bacterium]|nr:NAD kinase [Alphaproteobacteria bacterium]
MRRKDNMKIYFSASDAPEAQKALGSFTKYYRQASLEEADVIVSLGGDGQATQDLLTAIKTKKPIFGINYGHVGHFMNARKGIKGLRERIRSAEAIELSPLRVEATFIGGDIKTDFAVNEVQVCNDNRGQGINLCVYIDGIKRIPNLGADGVMVATTIGSTGYNKSAHGSALPLGDDLLAFTPNNAYRPECIHPTVIRPKPIRVEVLDAPYRKADVYADSRLLGKGASDVRISLDTNKKYKLLFDPGFSLHEKVMRTQFPFVYQFGLSV